MLSQQSDLPSAFGIERISECPACGGNDFASLSVPGRWIGSQVFDSLRGTIGLMRCRTCGMRFTNPRPDLRALEAFYSGDNYSCHTASGASSGGKKAEFLLDQIELACGGKGPKTMLDYGCGGGAFLKRALRCGWDARGFELGRRGRDECLKAGLNVAATVAELPDHQFRVITLHHVFEHIHDYRTALTDIRRLLSPGGVLFIEVPNASSLRAKLSLRILSRRLRFDERYRAFPIHLAYFDKRSLGTLLRRHGWIIRRSFTSGLGVEEF